MTAPRDPTAATRQKRARARGRTLTVILRSPDAIAALGAAAAVLGGVRPAIECALLDWARARGVPAGEPEPEPAPGGGVRRPRGGERPGGAASAPDVGK